MPLPAQIQLANTFGNWVDATNDIIVTAGNSSHYILVSQNATPTVSTGNISVNGVMTLATLKANGGIGTAGQFLTSNGSTIHWSTVVDANSSTSGLVNTAAQSLEGSKTFLSTVTVTGAATLSNTLAVTGAATLSNTLAVTGDITLSKGISANGAFGTAGQFLTSNATVAYWSTLSVVDANSSVSGLVNTAAQTFTGAKTFSSAMVASSTLGVTGAATFSSTIGVTGAITAAQAGNIIPFYFADQASFPSASSYHGAIAHSHSDGKVYFAHGGSWNEIVDVSSTQTMTNKTVSGVLNGTVGATTANTGAFTTLGATGAATLSSTLGVTGAATLSNTLAVTGDLTLSKGISANGGFGTAGQFLTSNATVAYWSTLSVVDANSSTSGLVNTSTQTFTGNKTFGNDVGISGNLTVSGTTTYINTTNLQIGDNIVTLNADLLANVAPTESAGIEINRGTLANTIFRWNESDDVWQATTDGTNYGTLIHTLSTTGINATALSTGTVPLARLDANVILTTSTTGINATALSVGTVPLARLASANTTANGVVDTTTQSFAGAKTFTGAVTASSTLGVTGAATLSSTLGVTGATTLSSTLGVTGATTLTTSIFNANTSTGMSANGKLTLNTTNGRFVLPVGSDLWAL